MIQKHYTSSRHFYKQEITKVAKNSVYKGKIMDTAKDYRILIAEDAVLRLEKIVREWNLPYPIDKKKTIELVKNIRTNLMKIKYSFLPSEMLLGTPEINKIIDITLKLKELMLTRTPSQLTLKQKLRYTEIKYALWILYGLKFRIARGDENNPLYAVDVIGVKIKQVEEHPSLPKLRITRAASQHTAFIIITNLLNIKRNEIRGAVVLPPIEFGGYISEAMYATETLTDEYLGKMIPTEKISKEVASKVIDITTRK